MAKKIPDEEIELLVNLEGYKYLGRAGKNKIKLICPNEHEIIMPYYNFKIGHRCKICGAHNSANVRKLKYEDVRRRVELLGCSLISDNYTNCDEKITIKCECGKLFDISLSNFLIGQRCRECGLKRISKKLTTNIGKIKDNLRNLGFSMLDDNFHGVKEKINIIDNDGYKYSVAYDNVIAASKGNGHICKFKVSNIYTLENMSLWLNINNKTFNIISTEFCGTDFPLLFKCQICNKKFEKMWSMISCSNQGCPYCAKISKKVLRERSFGALYPKFLKEWDYNKNGEIDPYKIRPQSNKKYWFVCSICSHSYDIILANKVKIKGGCTFCSLSTGEKIIYLYLEENSIHNRYQVVFDDLKSDLGMSLRYDFGVLYDNKITALIEYDGELHDAYVEYFHKSLDNFLRSKMHDKMKTNYANLHNIPMIRICWSDICRIEEILDFWLMDIKKNGDNVIETRHSTPHI